MRSSFVFLPLMGLALVSCTSKPVVKPAAPAPAERVSARPGTVKSGFQLRAFQEETLPNGLRLLWIPDSSLPRISLNMMVAVGSLDEARGQEGLNSLTAALLDQGTAHHSAPALAEALEQIGTDFNQAAGDDFTTLTSTGLASTRDRVLELFAEILLKPAFRESEIARRKAVTLSLIEKMQDQPSAFADQILDREIFGIHPYGTPPLGTLKSVASFSRLDLMRFYFAYYRPNNSTLSVVGQFDEDFKKKVRGVFAGWHEAPVKRVERAQALLTPARTVLVSKAGLQQTQIRMGHVGIARNNPDFMPLRIAVVILGGAFESRLNQRVRAELGLTYSIHAASDTHLEPGSFEISTFTRHEKAADTVLESQKVLREFVRAGVKEQELEAAKQLLVGQFPSALETPDRLAFNLMVLRRYGVSDDYLRQFQAHVQAITQDQVNQAIRRYLHPENLQTVIYSDQAALADQLPKLAPVETRPLSAE